METKVLEIAEKLVIASKRAYNRGIQTGSGGNVSARIPGTETMLVKASGGSLGDCTLEGFLITDFDGKLIKGNGKPTREALLHGYIYKMRGMRQGNCSAKYTYRKSGGWIGIKGWKC